MKYVSIPSECEAEQFLGFYHTPWPPGVQVKQGATGGSLCFVTTIQGQDVALKYGDYIIREPDGVHYYPCAAEVFVKRWKPKGA